MKGIVFNIIELIIMQKQDIDNLNISTEQHKDKALKIQEVFLSIFSKGIYLNLLVYFVVLIPFIVLLNIFAKKIDTKLGFDSLWNSPMNFILFIIFTILGISIVWWSYAYLLLIGGGSPSPHLGGPKKLVTTGPYAIVRHPSVIGKFFGVLGMGCFFASQTFLFIFFPLLIIYSLIYNRFYQEKGCEENFGNQYLLYRKEVPMIIPRLKKIRDLFSKKIKDLSPVITILFLLIFAFQLIQIDYIISCHAKKYMYYPVYYRQRSFKKINQKNLHNYLMIISPNLTIEDIIRGLHLYNYQLRNKRQKKHIAYYLYITENQRELIAKTSREFNFNNTEKQRNNNNLLNLISIRKK